MSFKKYITAFDHWIAFLLLLYLGGKMIYESTQEKEEDCSTNPLCYKTLCGLGIATSIDALAVGISLACIESAIALEALTIGIVTFLFSAFGVYFGNHFSRKIDLKLDLIGGLILICLLYTSTWSRMISEREASSTVPLMQVRWKKPS